MLSAPQNPTSCQLPAAVGERTTWEDAVYSNFIFSRHSKEIWRHSLCVINISIISIIPAVLEWRELPPCPVSKPSWAPADSCWCGWYGRLRFAPTVMSSSPVPPAAILNIFTVWRCDACNNLWVNPRLLRQKQTWPITCHSAVRLERKKANSNSNVQLNYKKKTPKKQCFVGTLKYIFSLYPSGVFSPSCTCMDKNTKWR